MDAGRRPDHRPHPGFIELSAPLSAGRRIALLFAGAKHAGENLERVLQERAAGLPPPMQMCDGLARNLPGSLETIVLDCLAHGRRQIVDVAAVFPAPCWHVLEKFGHLYRHDEQARTKQMSPERRLACHQEHTAGR